MPEPCADRVDVDSCTEQVSSRRMANGMGAYSLCCQSRHRFRHSFDVAFNHRMNAKSRDGLTTSIQKDVLGWSPRLDRCAELACRMRPQWTEALLIAFAVDLHVRMIPMGRMCELKIADAHVCRFICANTGVVQEQEEQVVAAALRGVSIGRGEQRIHLGFFQVGDGSLGCTLERDRSNTPTPFDAFRAMLLDESRQRMDRSESLVTRCQHAPSLLLQVLKELLHVRRSDMIDVEFIDWFVNLAGNERDEQSQRIAVATLRVARQIAFAHQMLKEKTPDPGTQLGRLSHVAPPERRTAQSVLRPRTTTAVS